MPELTFEGRRVAYLDQGTGAPLVLLHAGGSSGKQWVKTAAFLEDRFRAIAPDLWGFGLTESWMGEESLTHDHQALLVARVIEEVASGPVRGFLDYRNGDDTWAALPAAAKERFAAGTSSTVAGFRSNLSNTTSLEDIRRIHFPTLIMCGERTTAPDRRVTEILRDQMPKSRYMIIPGADHMSPLSHPEFIANAVRDHVASAQRADGAID